MLKRNADRGVSGMEYAAVIAVAAAVIGTLLVVLPDQFTPSVNGAVCRLFGGADCGGRDVGAPSNPSGTPTPAGAGQAQTPAPGQTQPVGGPESPEELQRQIDDAEREAREADREAQQWGGKLNLGDLAKEFGMEASGLGDAKRCLEGDLAGCGWTALTVIPGVGWLARGGKVAKAAKKLKKLKEAYNKYKKLAEAARKRAEAARERARQLREKLAKAKLCVKPNSFVAGTPVLLAGGRYKPIQDVDIGDLVWAADPQTGRAGPRAVTSVITGFGLKQLVRVTADPDGPGGADAVVITSTNEHPFWVFNDRAWKYAEDLDAGDTLLSSSGHQAAVTSTRELRRRERVYNLTVSDLHTYFVGDWFAVLVHNIGPLRCQPPEEIDDKITTNLNAKPEPKNKTALERKRAEEAAAAKNLEGRAGRQLRECVTQYNLKFKQAGGFSNGEIDIGTPGAVVEVYNGAQPNLADKGEQLTKYRGHPDVNPGGRRQVIFLAPNVSIEDRKRFEKERGARVFGSIDHLHNHLKRNGLC